MSRNHQLLTIWGFEHGPHFYRLTDKIVMQSHTAEAFWLRSTQVPVMVRQPIHDNIAHAVRMPYRELKCWRFGAQFGCPEARSPFGKVGDLEVFPIAFLDLETYTRL
jgi:hypothetical protein